MKVLNLGSLNIDNVYHVDEFPAPGETKLAAGLSLFCGGKGLNQSVAASRAGAEVRHAGLVGEDGGMLLEKLRENGVDTDLIFPVPGRCGHAVIQVNAKGQNCILLYGGANRRLTETAVDGIFDGFGEEGCVLLQNEINLLPYIIQKAVGRGLPVFFNAAPMDAGVLEYPIGGLAWLIVNEVEGRSLAGCADDGDILPALAGKYPALNVLLTLGCRGAVCRTPEKTVAVDALPVPVTDTTAAGDTFTGYFLHGVTAGMALETVLVRAATAAAICVSREGAADSIPLGSEVGEAVRLKTLGELHIKCRTGGSAAGLLPPARGRKEKI